MGRREDDEDMRHYRERMQRERDEAREKAMWAAAAAEERQLHQDDAEWEKDILRILREVEKKTGDSLDVQGMLDQVFADAKKRGYKKLTPEQKARAKRAVKNHKSQSGWCSVIAFLLVSGLGGIIFGVEELVRGLL